MKYIIICATALIVSAMTLFSGFGLGGLLMPAFALFFPVAVAIAATAIIHLANNIFKFVLIGRHADYKIVLKFVIPAIIFAVLGALLLGKISDAAPIFRYHIGTREFDITLAKIVIAVLVAVFAVYELVPKLENFTFPSKLIPLGGALSGFFGGLSGHQGALRTAFLINAGMDKKTFIATVVVCAVAVDISRLSVYGVTIFAKYYQTFSNSQGLGLLVAGMLAAFAGAFIGVRLIDKVTMKAVRIFVGILLLIFSVGLGSGLI
ncbi:MAG: sulfite exporter TauE/SafE family protein [Chloroflexi bacterium]|nr:sulfite exporter TauE/SafE family protein [Chloroflexota bacterium]